MKVTGQSTWTKIHLLVSAHFVATKLDTLLFINTNICNCGFDGVLEGYKYRIKLNLQQ